MDQPIGLQRLSELHCLEVHSPISWVSGLAGSKYEIRECSGQLLYDAYEERKGIIGLPLSSSIALLDVNRVEVISLDIPSSFDMCKVNVSMQSELVSVVKQKTAFRSLMYEVHGVSDMPRLPLYMIMESCYTKELQLSALNGTPLGTITRKCPGLMNARNDFIVSFPQDMELRYKAACIAATVLHIHIRRPY